MELLEHRLNREYDRLIGIIDSCKKLKGSYALAILDKNSPNTIYLAKNSIN